MRRILVLLAHLISLTAASYSVVANAQFQVATNLCETDRGTCSIDGFAPVGGQCMCEKKDIGTLIVPPANYSDFCQAINSSTVCSAYFAPMGSICRCGDEEGRITGLKQEFHE